VTLFKPQRLSLRKIAETFKDFPPTALALLDTLLAIEPSARGTVAWTARTKPLACDQASLPKYPPCKEYDAKLQGQEASRQNTAGIGGKGSVSVNPGRDDSKGTAPAQDLAIARQPEEHQPPLQLAGRQRAGLPH